jgi:hypothetical protein
MPQYLLLLHEKPFGPDDFSPEEMQGVIERYRVWSQKLIQGGRMSRGEKLKDEGGRILRADGSRLEIVDGPYAEAKEVVSGLFTIEAADYDEAAELCRDCPHLDFGWIELREIEPT